MFDWLIDYIMQIVPIADSMGGYLYLLIFAAAILESTPIIGTFTPGTLILVFFGFLVSVTQVTLLPCIVAASIGAALGDYIGYLLGRFGSRFFSEHKKILNIGHIDRGRAFFSKHGGKSILIGRFVGPIRPIVPLVAGAIRMSMRRFMPLNIFGAVLWSSVLISAGALVGQHWQSVEKWFSGIGIAGATIIAVAFIWVYIKRKWIIGKITILPKDMV